jgi:hypothetical protein
MGGSSYPCPFANQHNMVFNTVQHYRARHNMNTHPPDAYAMSGRAYPCSFASQGNMPFNTAQHNAGTNSTDAFPGALQSTHDHPEMSSTPAKPPSTKVEFLQNGTMHSLNLPIACSTREIESLQELAMNTQFGTTNLTPRRGAYITNVGNRLRAYCSSLESSDKIKTSEKIRGGIFDGLSKQEAEWLGEMGWNEGRVEPRYYLQESEARHAR